MLDEVGFRADTSEYKLMMNSQYKSINKRIWRATFGGSAFCGTTVRAKIPGM